jgi:uncharacterized membrane protein YozB (DUF420 family)
MLDALTMLIDWLLGHSSEITEMGNWIAVLSSGMALIAGLTWLKRNHLSSMAKTFVSALMGAMVYIGIHRTFWGLGLKFAEEGENYGAWFIQWKGFMTLPISVVLLVSIVVFIGAPEEFTRRKKLTLFFGIILLATGLTIL